MAIGATRSVSRSRAKPIKPMVPKATRIGNRLGTILIRPPLTERKTKMNSMEITPRAREKLLICDQETTSDSFIKRANTPVICTCRFGWADCKGTTISSILACTAPMNGIYSNDPRLRIRTEIRALA